MCAWCVLAILQLGPRSVHEPVGSMLPASTGGKRAHTAVTACPRRWMRMRRRSMELHVRSSCCCTRVARSALHALQRVDYYMRGTVRTNRSALLHSTFLFTHVATAHRATMHHTSSLVPLVTGPPAAPLALRARQQARWRYRAASAPPLACSRYSRCTSSPCFLILASS